MIKILKHKKDIIIIEDKNITFLFSYNTCIARKNIIITGNASHLIISLDRKYYNYSTTTSKHLSEFLGETKAQTQAKINSGEYILTDLN